MNNQALDVLKNKRNVSNVEKDADDLFFEMLSKQFKKIPDTQGKELLKVEIHRLVINVPTASNFSHMNNPQPNYIPPTNATPMHAPPTNQHFNISRRPYIH